MDTSNLATDPFYKGAEAELSFLTTNSHRFVVKHRVRKRYRNLLLDQRIISERTIAEASILHEAKNAGARVPSIIGIDPEANTIIMTHIDGPVLRDKLDQMSGREAKRVFRTLGEQIGLLHRSGIVHGDLTTSNIILPKFDIPFIVDFGLARRSLEPEDRGVDLHLLQRSINASHTQDAPRLTKHVFEGYRATAGEKITKSTLAKTHEISRRGRYFAIR